MMRALNEENAEEDRKIAIVRSAISTLSFSELQAIKHIFSELDGKEVPNISLCYHCQIRA